jgi:hypothetical protein
MLVLPGLEVSFDAGSCSGRLLYPLMAVTLVKGLINPEEAGMDQCRGSASAGEALWKR